MFLYPKYKYFFALFVKNFWIFLDFQRNSEAQNCTFLGILTFYRMVALFSACLFWWLSISPLENLGS